MKKKAQKNSEMIGGGKSSRLTSRKNLEEKNRGNRSKRAELGGQRIQRKVKKGKKGR